jgi:hypothetical protein
MLSLQANRLFQIDRALNCDQMFDFSEILFGNEAADNRMEAKNAYLVLRLLINSPELKDWPVHGAAALDPPTNPGLTICH